jgi:hypothetical protein
MPIVSAYLCPRTDVLFKDKVSYVAHLREMARDSLIKKRIEREIVPLRDSFARLRLSAAKEEDIRSWLYKNQNEITRLAFIKEPGRYDAVKLADLHADIKPVGRMILDTEASGQQVQLLSSVPLPEDETKSDLIVGVLRLEWEKNKAFLIVLHGILKLLPGLSSLRNTNGVVLNLYAEDWVFVARKALYENHTIIGTLHWGTDAEDIHSLSRIIERRYPALTFEKYKAICGSGLVGADGVFDESSFMHWLSHQGEVSVDLPDLLASGDSLMEP